MSTRPFDFQEKLDELNFFLSPGKQIPRQKSTNNLASTIISKNACDRVQAKLLLFKSSGEYKKLIAPHLNSDGSVNLVSLIEKKIPCAARLSPNQTLVIANIKAAGKRKNLVKQSLQRKQMAGRAASNRRALEIAKEMKNSQKNQIDRNSPILKLCRPDFAWRVIFGELRWMLEISRNISVSKKSRRKFKAGQTLFRAMLVGYSAIKWRMRTIRALKARKYWRWLMHICRWLRKTWRKRRIERAGNFLQEILVKGIKAGKTRIAVRRLLAGALKIQSFFRKFLIFKRHIIKSWFNAFEKEEHKYLNDRLRAQQEGLKLKNNITEFLSSCQVDWLSEEVEISRKPRRRANFAAKSPSALNKSMTAAIHFRQLTSMKMETSLKLYFLETRFHKRMKERSISNKTLVQALKSHIRRVSEFRDFLQFFDAPKKDTKNKSERAILIKSFLSGIGSAMKGLQNLSDFSDISKFVAQCHTENGWSI